MKLKPKGEIWVVRTYDNDYEMENFYNFTNESDTVNFVSGEIATNRWNNNVQLGKHEEVCALEHTIKYGVEENEDETR